MLRVNVCCDFAVKQGQKACADEAETSEDVLLNPGLKMTSYFWPLN